MKEENNRDEIFQKLNEGIRHVQNKYSHYEIEFFNNFIQFVDKYNYYPIWELFYIITSPVLKIYKKEHNPILNYLTSKLLENNKNSEITKLIHDFITFLNDNSNPIIKDFLKEQNKLIIPELREDINEYEDFINPNELSLSNLNLKEHVEGKSSTQLSSGEISDHMTKKEKEEDLKEKMKVIIKTSHENREYYEDIFQDLIKETENKNKNLNLILLNILNRKLTKYLFNLNKNINGKALNYNVLITRIIEIFFENVHHPKMKLSHIILRIQICFLFNVVKFSLEKCSKGNDINNFNYYKRDDVKKMIENCFKSLYVEANRAYNKVSKKGDLTVIKEENFENNNEDNFDEINNDMNNTQNFSQIYIHNNNFELEEKEDFLLLEMEILDCYDKNQNIVSEIDLNFSLNSSLNLNNNNTNSQFKSTFLYSKYSHIFSLSGYTNLIDKSQKELMKEISILMKSEYLPKEILDKFKEFIEIIFELEKLFLNEDKGKEYYKMWMEKNSEIMKKHNLDYVVKGI